MIKHALAISALCGAIALPASSFAQSTLGRGTMGMSQPASMTAGEVKKVDREAGKVTIQHGYIESLDMPGMTMVYTAKDKALLGPVKAGDKVKFMVVNEGGKLVLTDIQPAK
ncbi:MAG: copper-binding protein [Rubrivivax sp. SCN 70-15]|nr:MAG: copper-binding protein [Rubrivivax sp. SCN 70-15]